MHVFSFAAGPEEERFPQVAAADWAFRRRGWAVTPFTFDDLRDGRLDEALRDDPAGNLVFGPVGAVLGALDRGGFARPPRLDFPPELAHRLARRIVVGTLGAVRASDGGNGPHPWPVHVKPKDDHKLFTGRPVRAFQDLLPLKDLPADTPVWVQDHIELVSEWRATTLRGRVVHLGHYKGDPLAVPDPAAVRGGAAEYASAPAGYGADWGVTAAGDTVLVEVNDGFSLGNYGCPGPAYAEVLRARWRELVGAA